MLFRVIDRLECDDREMVALVPAWKLAENGVPDLEVARKRNQAAPIVTGVLRDEMHTEGVKVSLLGPEWSADFDVYVREMPDPERLRAAGWMLLDPLLHRLGSKAFGRWAVVDQSEIIGVVDIHNGLPPTNPLETIERRCHRLGVVRIREILELRAAARMGCWRGKTNRTFELAADTEAALGGSLLGGQSDRLAGQLPPIRVRLGACAAWRRRLGKVRAGLRPNVIVAISGIEGAGKSTVTAQLIHDLTIAGVPVGVVKARLCPHLGPSISIATNGKTLLHRGAKSFYPSVSRSQSPQFWRQLIGAALVTLATLSFLRESWRQHIKTRGVVIWDQHALDALVTLHTVHAGFALYIPQYMVKRLLPRTSETYFLDVDAGAVASREPSDETDLLAVTERLRQYRSLVKTKRDVTIIDGRSDPSEISQLILRDLLQSEEVAQPPADE